MYGDQAYTYKWNEWAATATLEGIFIFISDMGEGELSLIKCKREKV